MTVAGLSPTSSTSGKATSARSAMRPIEILLVEDNPGDKRLTIEVFREGKISNHLSVAGDRVEALAFVRREGRFTTAPRPDLILLSLDLSVADRHQVLAEITADPNLATIPLVIVTRSRIEHDILRSQQLAATAYLTKPVDLPQLIGLVESIEDFGLIIATAPRQSEPTYPAA